MALTKDKSLKEYSLRLLVRDRREYQYRIEKADTKPFGISIGLDRGFF